jgi:putative membrane protein
MLTTSALTASLAAHPWGAGGAGGGPGWWIVFPILWFLLFATVVFLVARRARRGFGGPWGHQGSPAAVLGERYARGEIDETEYRRRLAVLRGERTS